jgi:hypothetical protein
MKKLVTLRSLAAIALALGTIAFNTHADGANGTTLAAIKTIGICDTADGQLIYGEISVWNEGVVDTVGLAISDVIQRKVGKNWVPVCTPTIGEPITEIPAGTTLDTATIYHYSCNLPAGTISPTDLIKNTASITILNHSGSLFKAKGPSPSATWNGEFHCLPPEGCVCPLSMGYWGNPDHGADTRIILAEGAQQDAKVRLANQYYAALDNIANGACLPADLDQTLADAAALLALDFSCPPGPPSANCSKAVLLAGLLEDWNTSCEE